MWRIKFLYCSIFLSPLSIFFFLFPSLAQIIPDNTLGNESSTVVPNATIKNTTADLIEGGARRDNNLFHSFSEFNIGDRNAVYFSSPDGVANILTRVTGNNSSNIFGTLGINGTANLFLLNPNGIVFGENAILDINGSFLGTTADSYIFDNGFAYSASNPDTPALLTVNIPLGLQFGVTAKSIVNQSQVPSETEENISQGIGIREQENISLVGGDIVFEAGYLTAPNGRVEIGSVAPHSLVTIVPIDNNWTLNYQGITEFQNIDLTDGAKIDSSGGGGGNIQLQGKEISLRGGSTIFANSIEENGGILQVNASAKLEISGSEGIYEDETFIRSGLYADAFGSGRGNDIEIKTQHLSIKDEGIIRAEVFDLGNGGNISIQATDMTLSNYGILSTLVNYEAIGLGGNLTIDAKNVLIQDSFITGDTFDEGDGGNIIFNVEQLQVMEGGNVSTSTFGRGKGGNIAIAAQEIEISGTDGFHSSLNSVAGDLGQGGNIKINAEKLFLTGEAAIDASAVYGRGNSGNIDINVEQLKLEGTVAQIATVTNGEGNGGNLSIHATDSVQISGFGLFPSFELEDESMVYSSGLFATVEGEASGNGGTVTVETDLLQIFDGGEIIASTAGMGNAGNITLRANTIEVKDAVIDTDGNRSGINSNVGKSGEGNGGNLNIFTDSLRVTQGGSIAVDSFGRGNAGNIFIEAKDISLSGASSGEGILGNEPTSFLSQISAFAQENFDAGSIKITTNSLNVSDRAEISVSNNGLGNSGDLSIVAQNLSLDNAGQLSAKVNGGEGGNISLSTDNIFLSNQGSISAEAEGISSGGNIAIDNTDNLVLLNNSRILANATEGDGGNINISTQGYLVSADSLVSASSDFGLDGNIEIETINSDRRIELYRLPENPINTERQIIASCAVGQNQFAISGQGGLPVNPTQKLRGQAIWQDLRGMEIESQHTLQPNSILEAKQSKPIQEAQAWKINSRGNIQLIATNLTNIFLHNQTNCNSI